MGVVKGQQIVNAAQPPERTAKATVAAPWKRRGSKPGSNIPFANRLVLMQT